MVTAGCTGEFWSLSLEERAHLARLTVEASDGRGPAIVGTGSIREGEVIEQIHAAQRGRRRRCPGPATLLRPSDRSRDDRPFRSGQRRVQSCPSCSTTSPATPETRSRRNLADRLADLDKVVAIKESQRQLGQFPRHADRRERPHPRLLRPLFGLWRSGDAGRCRRADRLLSECLGARLSGSLAQRRGRAARTRPGRCKRTGIALTELFTSDGRTLYPATKAAMNHLGLPGGGAMRPPLRDLDGAAAKGPDRRA